MANESGGAHAAAGPRLWDVVLLPNPDRLDFDAVRAKLAAAKRPSPMWVKLDPPESG